MPRCQQCVGGPAPALAEGHAPRSWRPCSRSALRITLDMASASADSATHRRGSPLRVSSRTPSHGGDCHARWASHDARATVAHASRAAAHAMRNSRRAKAPRDVRGRIRSAAPPADAPRRRRAASEGEAHTCGRCGDYEVLYSSKGERRAASILERLGTSLGSGSSATTASVSLSRCVRAS